MSPIAAILLVFLLCIPIKLLDEKRMLLERNKELIESIKDDERDLTSELRQRQREFTIKLENEKKDFRLGYDGRLQRVIK